MAHILSGHGPPALSPERATRIPARENVSSPGYETEPDPAWVSRAPGGAQPPHREPPVGGDLLTPPRGEHRARGHPQHPRRHAAQDEAADTGPPVGADHDHIRSEERRVGK